MLSAGPQALSVTFAPTDTTNYQSTTATATLTVNKATPIVYWPNPAPLAYGLPLNSLQLDAITSGVAGTFSYIPPAGTVPSIGSQVLSATYTPVDLQNYVTVTANQTITIVGATPPVIESQPQDQSATLGQSATFTVAATGQGSLTYLWRKNSVDIQNATDQNYSTPPSTAADDGALYTVVVSDATQHTKSMPAKMTVFTPTQKSYYVSVDGNDQSDGSKAHPFGTLHRAQIAMQSSPIKVTQIEGGTFYLSSPLALTGADQGETLKAVPGSSVILSGGIIIDGWSSEGKGIYSAKSAHPVVIDLTVSKVRQVPADRGYDSGQPYTSGWRVIAPSQTQGYNATFSVQPNDLTESVKPGAIVQLIDHCRWNDLFTRIVSVDKSDSTITVARTFDTGSSGGLAGSWRVLSDPADLSMPGQFAYDPVASKVYLMPARTGTLNSETVVAAELGTLISINGATGITISGLTFSDTTSNTIQSSGVWDDSRAAITAEGLSNSKISGNKFLNVGKGIVLRGSSNNAIIGNRFEHLGVSGISLFSNSNYNTIASNSLTDIGQVNLLSFGVSINDSSFNLVDSNFIDRVGRWGIVFGPSGETSDLAFSNTGNIFSNNVIRDTSNRTNDSGAIYGGAQTIDGYIDENLLITGNRIENVGGLVRNVGGSYAAGFAQGIYIDDHASGVTITNNLVESGSTYGVVLCHGCNSNVASNNVVILQPAPVYDRGSYGAAFATGNMGYNGTTRIDLLPSYFPEDISDSTIAVQLSGQSFGGISATFKLEVDGVIVGTGAATDSVTDFIFEVALAPHQSHRIGVALTNGADTGSSTTALHNLALFVNATAVALVAPEAKGHYGSYGFAAIPDDLMVSNFSVTQNIVYRNGGLSQDVYDMTPAKYPDYIDPNPGTIDSNLLYLNVSKAADAIFGGKALDENSSIADPFFANPSQGDYRIRPESPAFTLGFKTSGVPLVP